SIIKFAAKISSLYCPRGPVVCQKGFDSEILVKSLVTLGKEKEALFFRFDPPVEGLSGIDSKKIRSVTSVQPKETLLVDLKRDKKELLARMHHKTRYNLRLAERKGVEIETSFGSFEKVWSVFEQTAKRGGFRLHSKEYYQQMLEALQGETKAFLAVATYKDEILAANLMIDFNEVRTYLHGASSNKHRDLMAPYLLHWKLIEDAKDQGLAYYDWWGVAPEHEPKHPWAGISRFKLGFGGERIIYPGTYDLVIDPLWYSVYTLARTGFRKFR
ncbi:lipid II:glycine glycyltransferase FemX, partial [Patescibacteria group bacterium]